MLGEATTGLGASTCAGFGAGGSILGLGNRGIGFAGYGLDFGTTGVGNGTSIISGLGGLAEPGTMALGFGKKGATFGLGRLMGLGLTTGAGTGTGMAGLGFGSQGVGAAGSGAAALGSGRRGIDDASASGGLFPASSWAVAWRQRPSVSSKLTSALLRSFSLM